MNEKLKNILPLVLICLFFCFMPKISYSADEPDEVEVCGELNILRGEGYGLNDEYLSKSATRLQAAILTLRLWGSGYEEIAVSLEWKDNFADANEIQWKEGRNILGFLKANPQFGWRGSTDGKFYPMQPINGKMFYKCLLEILGYKQDYGEGGDFVWDNVELFASQKGLWQLLGKEELTNRDLAIGLVEALKCNIKDSENTLAEKLVEQDVIAEEKAVELGLIKNRNEIVSVYSIILGDVYIGESIELPEKAGVIYSNGEKGEVPVIWKDIPDTTTEGLKTITGEVEGSKLKAIVTYNVLPIELKVEKITADNLKEITIRFSDEVDVEKATDINNYNIKVGTLKKDISKVILSEDKKEVKLVLNTEIGQQQKAEITIKKEIGLDNDVVMPISIFDVNPPNLINVEAIGNRRIKVVFSEPVKNITTLTNYYLDGKILTKGIVKQNADAIVITLEDRLSEGIHNFTVSDFVSDYAGNRISEKYMYFRVYDDKVLPEIENVVDVTQTSLSIRFSKAVEEFQPNQVVDANGARAISIIPDDELKIYTIEFMRTAAIKPEGTEIVLNNITDVYGNKNTLKVSVIPKLDMIPPELKEYEVINQNSIILEFTEDVLPESAACRMVSVGGVNVVLNQAEWYKDETGKYIKNKIVLKKLGEGLFEPGIYNIYIDTIADYTPLENKMPSRMLTIEIKDQLKPEIKNISIKDNQFFIKFNEKINPEIALKKENYRYLDFKTYASLSIPEESQLELLEDGMTVIITLPENFDISTINVLQISGIKDLAGNLIEAKGFFAPFASINTTPEIISVAIIGKNEIELILSNPIKKETLAKEDFIVSADNLNINISSITYDESENKIILVTNENFSADGRYGGINVSVKTSSSILRTTDIYGQSLKPLSATIAKDKYAPYVTGITSNFNGINTNIILTLSENIKTTYGTGNPLVAGSSELNQFIVMADDKVKPIISSRYDAQSNLVPPRITLTIEGNQTGKKIRVLFFAGPQNTLTDYATPPNALTNFEM